MLPSLSMCVQAAKVGNWVQTHFQYDSPRLMCTCQLELRLSCGNRKEAALPVACCDYKALLASVGCPADWCVPSRVLNHLGQPDA